MGAPNQLNVNRPAEIAQEINEFFFNKVENIREGKLTIPNPLTGPKNIMKTKRCTLYFNCVPPRKENKLLISLKNSRSAAVDQLDNFILKAAADIVDDPVHHIINMFVKQQKFPISWKFSKVNLLHKKLCKLDKNNYRPEHPYFRL